jgi:putative sigma-54 modulation protein
MRVIVVARHSSIAPEIEGYTNKKLLHLQKLSRRIEKCEIIFGRERKKHVAEMVLSLRTRVTLVARVKSDDLHAAVDMAVEKLERQLDKHKARLVRKRRLAPQATLEAEEEKEEEQVEKED